MVPGTPYLVGSGATPPRRVAAFASLPNLLSTTTPREIVAPRHASLPDFRLCELRHDAVAHPEPSVPSAGDVKQSQRLLSKAALHGVLYTSAAGVIVGLNDPLLTRFIEHSGPFASATLLGTGAATMVLAAALPQSGRPILHMSVAAALVVGAALVVNTASSATGLLALQHTSAASVTLTFNIEPIITSALAWAIFHQRPSSHMAAAGVASLASTALCAVGQLKQSSASAEGIGLALASAVTFAINEQLLFPMSAYKGAQIVSLMSIMGICIDAALSGTLKEGFPQGKQAAALFGCGAMGSVAQVAYVLGVRSLGPGRAAIITSVLAVTTGVLVSCAMGEGQFTGFIGGSLALALLSAAILGHEAISEPFVATIANSQPGIGSTAAESTGA